ncbi:MULTISPECIES: MAC/perforin domain-containing protein [unclassified Sphingobacterium]|uniref:MAC/perforin domain-containing protein n=1 Tax=unclassified Sphingobacterium TaxID=2609468 RepID=UPI0025EAA3E6|nr:MULTISPECIES: MAC/perforin domain-containing protein [unclassified Sphingobacterium]
MKNCVTLYVALLTLMLFSCNKSNNLFTNSDENYDKELVLMKRLSDEPFLLSKKKVNVGSMRASSVTSRIPQSYIGQSYNTAKGNFGDAGGLGIPVIDLDKIIASEPSLYKPSLPIHNTDAKYFAYSNFDRYQEKSNKSSTVKGGFQLRVGPFSFGAKKSQTTVFGSELVNESNSVFGELNITVVDEQHTLTTSENIINRIKSTYLHPLFLDELYNNHPTEFVNSHGGFVTTSIQTGGKATALYSGKYVNNLSVESHEKNMEKSISASYSFNKRPTGKPDSLGVDFSLGKANSSYIAKQNNISNFWASVRTFGGKYGFNTFTPAKSLDDININFADWTNSLNDKSTHVMIDFGPEGLLPITQLIREENIRKNIEKQILTNSPSAKLTEPSLVIVNLNTTGSGSTRNYATFLTTRYGDRVLLDAAGFASNLSTANFNALFNAYISKKRKFYGVKVTQTSIEKLNQDVITTNFQYIMKNDGTSQIDENRMVKFTKGGILYILDVASKIGYSIPEDYLLDTYLMRSWVDLMALVQITDRQLDEYVIVGL